MIWLEGYDYVDRVASLKKYPVSCISEAALIPNRLLFHSFFRKMEVT